MVDVLRTIPKTFQYYEKEHKLDMRINVKCSNIEIIHLANYMHV